MIRFQTTWVRLRLKGDDLEGLLEALLGHFHGLRQPDFEVYNAWSLQSDQNELYLSPAAFSTLIGQPRPPYQVVGWVDVLPAGCDLLMGDQTIRRDRVIDLPAYFRPAPRPSARKRLNGMGDPR
jgi:hypothetical protein